ncbi:hypothetical protein DFH07DRAFT_814263 [Mycena maculata]|uniref:Plant basic secretory protein n=1 Tax=Mycena maculata TaxID=230809 RepID=A0AAD7JD47_9AGAR|nr:hypothetical protein DFH07DRAFT_814263 [Mycena maculata]
MPPTSPPSEPEWPLPKFTLRIEDLTHPGAVLFLENVQPAAALRAAVLASFNYLYATPACAPTNVASIVLVLRPMAGVAHTFGSHTEKEIHFSLDHIVNSAGRARDEILGVLVHEVVHCYQHNANGTAPGGLIEGIAGADPAIVTTRRLTAHVQTLCACARTSGRRTGSARRAATRSGTRGYQTTAYFLDWIDRRAGAGTVRALNAELEGKDYDAAVFERLTGESVNTLWRRYKVELAGGDPDDFQGADEELPSDEGFTLV